MANTNTEIIAINRLQATPVSAVVPTNGQVLQYNGTTWIPTTFSGSITVDNGLTMTANNIQLRGILTNYDTTLTTKVLKVGDVGYDAGFLYKNYKNFNVEGEGNVVIGSGPVNDLANGLINPIGYDNAWYNQGKLCIVNKANTLGGLNPYACLYIRNQNPNTEKGIYMQMFNVDQTAFTKVYWGIQMYMNDKNTYGQYLEVMPFVTSDSYCIRNEVRSGGVVDIGGANLTKKAQAITASQVRGNGIETGNVYGLGVAQYGNGHGMFLKAYDTQWDNQNPAYQTWTSNEYQSLLFIENASAKKVETIYLANTGVANITKPFMHFEMSGTTSTLAHVMNYSISSSYAGNIINIAQQGSGDMIFAENLSPTNTGYSLRLKQQGTGFGLNVTVDNNGFANFGVQGFDLNHKIGIYNAGSTGWAYKGIGGTYTVLDSDTYLRITFGQVFGTITLPDPALDTQRGRHIYIDAEGNGAESFTCTVANKIDNPLTYTPTTTYVETAQVRPSWEIISTGTIWKINTISRSV